MLIDYTEGVYLNSYRLATMLRQLAQYHAKNTGHLFMVRIAQGLTHLGKGTLSLCPFHTDRQVMNFSAVAGLLITLVSFLDTKTSKISYKYTATLVSKCSFF